MPLTLQEVEHVARLARLALTDEEKERFREQLSAVLEHAARLEELDTDPIPPTASILPLRTVLRADEARPPASREDVLANAPSVEEGRLLVQPVRERERSPESTH